MRLIASESIGKFPRYELPFFNICDSIFHGALSQLRTRNDKGRCSHLEQRPPPEILFGSLSLPRIG
jgi:hypothetical protein